MTEFTFDKDILVGFLGGARYERQNKSENYVTVPPALLITDSDGAAWTLGRMFRNPHRGEFEFSVMRNDVDTGELAKRIEYRAGVVWIFGSTGWKHFSRSRRHFI